MLHLESSSLLLNAYCISACLICHHFWRLLDYFKSDNIKASWKNTNLRNADMLSGIKLFVCGFIFVLCLDMLWLGFIAKNIYADSIGILLRKSGENLSPNWPAAMLVYLAIISGILIFVLPKTNGSLFYACIWGGLFGAIMYGIYDFTNFSILANWPLKITLIDFVWGMVLCACTSLFCVWLQKWVTA